MNPRDLPEEPGLDRPLPLKEDQPGKEKPDQWRGYGEKSQGSEWREVLTILDPSYGGKMVCDRAWLYTAISRARDVQHLIGARSTADAMCQRVNVNQRKTFLAELVGAEEQRLSNN